MSVNIKEYTIFSDGSCSGQGTPYAVGGYGVRVMSEQGSVHTDLGKTPESVKKDSNAAESFAFLTALQWADKVEGILDFRMDSMFVINAIGNKSARSIDYAIWDQIVYLLQKNASRIRSIKLIKSEDNLADGLAKKASQSAILLDGSGNCLEFDASQFN